MTIAALFAAENLWLLPKADFVRVIAEALGLFGIAILDYYQTKENTQLLRSQPKSKKPDDANGKNKKLFKSTTAPWKQKDSGESAAQKIMNRKRRRLILILLTLSCYAYIDATGLSPYYHIQRLFTALPIPSKQRKKIKSRVRR